MSNFIPSEHSDKQIFRYDLLFEEGLKFVQHYSGKIWTDYNYHDPGVTFLEYLAYALTDLGYRTNFPIEDLFLFGKGGNDPVKENLLFGPATVFSSSPVIINDFRKLLIDRIKLVANAWVVPVKDHNMGLKGIFDIFIECSEELIDLELDYLKKEVEDLFHSNRLLGHDLGEVFILKKVSIRVEGSISIESDALGELVLAKIHSLLDSYVNPQVQFQDPIKLWKEEGKNPEEVFAGPLPKYGFIDENELTPKLDAIYLSRIKELILSVEGVKEIWNLQLLKNDIPVFDNFVHFEKNEFPRIQYLDNITDTFESNLRVFKNNVVYEVYPIITKQLITSEVLTLANYYYQELRYEEKLPEGRFTPEQLKSHFPIHNELPDFFGVGKNGVSKDASKEVRASTLQVSAYLYFFEQIMASYLAQLAGLSVLFSTQKLTVTYFNQIPDKIPNLEKDLLKIGGPSLQKLLDQFSEESSDYFDRRNRLMDHLLARFGESLDEANLKKVNRSGILDSKEDFAEKILETKINLLNAIVELGKTKAKAFDIKADQVWDSDAVSGIEKRIALSLGISNYKRIYLSGSLLDHFVVQKANTDNSTWELVDLPLENGPIKAFKLPDEAYEMDSFKFYGKGEKFIREIFELLNQDKAIVSYSSSQDSGTFLLMKQRLAEFPFVLFKGKNSEACQNAKDKFLRKLEELDQLSEGFHLLENILLRPLESVSYVFACLNANGEEFIEGLFPGDLEQQKSLGEDLFSICVQSENYSVVEEKDSGLYEIWIYNFNHEPLAKFKKSFNSKPGAKKAIQESMLYFQEMKIKSFNPESVIDVKLVGGLGHGFPADFPFSNTLSFIFPNWPSRFQKSDFVKFVMQLIGENIMAHQSSVLYFLNLNEMSQFEQIFYEWLHVKNQDETDLKKIDQLSLQLIQFLRQRQPVF